MEKTIIWVIALLTVISCNKYSDVYDQLFESSHSDIIVRSDYNNLKDYGKYDVTQRMAELFIATNKDNPQIVNVQPYVIDGITCFYIINFENGFKIVAADKRVSPILAESDEDNLYPDNLENPGIKVWLDNTADHIHVIKVNNIETKCNHSDLWEAFVTPDERGLRTRSLDPNQDSVWIKTMDISTNPYIINAHVPHLMTTMWGQGSPWNANMPTMLNQHCLTGCVPVAISQVLYYFHVKDGYPNDLWHDITVSTLNPDFSVTLIKSNHVNNSGRWIQMPLVAVGSGTSYVSDLMLDIGERVQVKYGTQYSGVDHNSDYSIPNISQCGISSSFGNYSFSTVKNNLLNNKPVIVSAWFNSNLVGGHTWVIDGCEDYTNRVVETSTFYYVAVEDVINYSNWVASYSNSDMLSMYPNAYNGMQETNVYYDDIKQLRMNWGHDGVGNSGYYGVLDTSDWYDPYYGLYLNYTRVIHYNISTGQLN